MLTDEDNDGEVQQTENVELTSVTVDRNSCSKSPKESKGPDNLEQDDDEASLLANRG